MKIYYKYIKPVVKKSVYSLISFFLNFIGLLLFWARVRPGPEIDIKNILIVKLEHMGDLVLSIPAIIALKEKFPHSRISLIIDSKFKSLVENLTCIDKVIMFNQGASVLNRIHFIRDLKKSNYDLAIDFTTRDFFFSSVGIVAFCGAAITIGLNNYGRGFIYKIRVRPKNKLEFYSSEVLHIIEPLGVTTKEYKPYLPVPDENDAITSFLVSKSINNLNNFFVIHAGGSHESQHWEIKNYAKVIDYFINDQNIDIILIGSTAEKKLNEKLCVLVVSERKPYNLAGDISLDVMVYLLSRAKLFIGSNSGPLHLACAFKIPTVSLMGPTVPQRWQPQGEKDIILRGRLSHKLYEAQYSQNPDYDRLRPITPEEVINAINKQLQNFF